MLAKFADFQIFVALVSAIIVASFAKLLTAQDERPTIVEGACRRIVKVRILEGIELVTTNRTVESMLANTKRTRQQS